MGGSDRIDRKFESHLFSDPTLRPSPYSLHGRPLPSFVAIAIPAAAHLDAEIMAHVNLVSARPAWLPVVLTLIAALFASGTLTGCSNLGLGALSWDMLSLTARDEESESDEDEFDDDFETKIEVPMVGDYTTFTGLHRVVLEGVGLVVGLNGTGGDPPPSPEREALLDDMRRRNVKNSKEILRSPNTALVVVRAYLPPLAKKGDRFDVQVRIPGEDGATSLNGGRLLETILSETAIVPGRGRLKGHIVAKAKGPILVAPASGDIEDRAGVTKRGKVLGGGLSMIDRDMALYVKSDFRTFRNVTRLADRIGLRFSAYDRYGVKEPLAKAQTDQRIILQVHPSYREDFPRYMQVVQAIAFRESAVAQRVRVKRLEQQLQDPATAQSAAIQLEAIGEKAIPILKSGLKSPELECRFHASVALAYLGESDGIETLHEAALKERAFRVYAFAALSIMDDPQAHLALRDLMHVHVDEDGTEYDSAETRYGAFRALWTLDSDDPFIAGAKLNGEFWLHSLDTQGRPMVHITIRKRPEVVLFDGDQQFLTPMTIRVGRLLVTSKVGSDQVSVSRYTPYGDADEQRKVVSKNIGDVIIAAAELGASYPDVAQLLIQADAQKNLPGRFEIDALPQAGRVYFRNGDRSRVGRSSFTPNMFDKTDDETDEDFGAGGEVDDQEEPSLDGASSGEFEDSESADDYASRRAAALAEANGLDPDAEEGKSWSPLGWFKEDDKE